MEKKKIKIPWITMASVLALVIQAVLASMGVELESEILNGLITAICGLLAVVGIIAPKEENAPAEEESEKDKKEDDKSEK